MPAKRFFLIILCILLAVMAVLFAVVGKKFAPILGMLSSFGDSTVTTAPPSTTVPQSTTTDPTQSTTITPTETEPTQPPTEPPTTAPTEPPHEHSYSVSKVVKAGCGSMGYTVYVCSCGKNDIRDIVEAKDHVYGEGTVVDATCEEQGYTEFICTNCGHSDKHNYTDPIGHDYQLVEVQEPSCVQDGYELYRCTNCEGEKKENEVIAPGHTCEDWEEIVAPGPGVPGEETGVCTTCSETVTRPCAIRICARYKAVHENFYSYTVYVGTDSTPKALEYIIHDYSMGVIRFEYTENGLVVFLNDVELTTLAAYQNMTLTIDADGNIIGGETPQPPEPTDPVVPPEEEDDGEE